MAALASALGALHGAGLAAVIVVGIRMLAWLAGLVISLNHCPPKERPDVLRAYGASQPRLGPHLPGSARKDHPSGPQPGIADPDPSLHGDGTLHG